MRAGHSGVIPGFDGHPAPEDLRPIVVGGVVLAVAIIVDLTTSLSIAGYFGLGPLIIAAACPPRTTYAVGGFAVAVAVVSGLWDNRFGNGQHLAAIALVIAQSAVAVYICVHRMRRRSELRQVRAVAEVAQRALLPAVPARLTGAGFAARYLSAAREASVGGDLYEVVHTSHSIRVIIGDVRGKGLPAVRLASVVLGAFREAAVTWLEPEQVAAACARAVSREAEPEDFVTALIVDIHPDGRLALCSAGHHPPELVSSEGSTTLTLRSPSPPLGLAERFTVTTAQWAIGDRLLLFTDGLIEARDDRARFFPLEDHLDTLRGGSQEEALDRLTDALSTHAAGNLHDDLALLLIERLPVGRPVEPSAARTPPTAAPTAAASSAASSTSTSTSAATTGDDSLHVAAPRPPADGIPPSRLDPPAAVPGWTTAPPEASEASALAPPAAGKIKGAGGTRDAAGAEPTDGATEADGVAETDRADGAEPPVRSGGLLARVRRARG